MRWVILAACLFANVVGAAAAEPNMDFEAGEVGKPPPEWTVKASPSNADVSATTDADRPDSGQKSATLSIAGIGNADVSGQLRRTIDAAPYRGKYILLSAALRTSVSAKTPVFMWVLAEGARGELFPDATTEGQPTVEWKKYKLILWVPNNAAHITIALSQLGPGKSGLDSVGIQTVDSSEVGFEPPRALKEGGLRNIRAFARLFGYVRFFHPSDEAASVDWNKIAMAGVQRVENASNPAALVEALRAVFMPLAPTLRIFQTGSPAPQTAPALLATQSATIVGWEHHGVDLGNGDPSNTKLYTSKRVTVANPKPNEPFAADLGGGVSILMPTTLYRNQNGTLPHVAIPAAAILLDKPQLFAPSGRDRTTRLADVVLSWTVFQHFYPYFEEEPTDWSAALDAALKDAATDRDQTEFADTLSKMVARLRDGHAQVFLANQKELELPLWWEWIENRLVVTLITSGSGGLNPGDVVDRIGGRSVTNEMAAIAPTISAATPQWKMVKLLTILKRTKSSAPVRIEGHRAGGKRFVVILDPVDEYLPYLNRFPLKTVCELRSNIWYVDLRRATEADLNSSIKQLTDAKAIVFDVRGYPTRDAFTALAHLSDRPIQTEQFNVPISTLPDRASVTYEQGGFQIPPQAPDFRGKFEFLTNGEAVSYAEMIMGMVKDNHLGEIVGSTTAGTDGDINTIALPGGYSINWSGTRVQELDGSRFEGVGIKPTVLANQTIAGIRAGRDEVLNKAIQIIIKQGRWRHCRKGDLSPSKCSR